MTVEQPPLRWLAPSLALFGAATFIPASIWQVGHTTSTLSSTAILGQGLGLLTLGAVGLMLAVRRPGNVIGWIFLSSWTYAGLLAVVTAFAQAHLLEDPQGTNDLATWFVNWMWVPLIGVIVLFPLLLFPTGRVPGPRWRPLVPIAVGVIALWAMAFAFQTSQYTDAFGAPVPGGNPYATPWAASFIDTLPVALAVAYIALVLAALASLVQRFRRGDTATKAQLKWFLLGGLCWLPVLLYPGDHGEGGIIDVLMGLAVAALPLAMAVAIMRYRLYDIDRILSRTASYTIVTGVLVATYGLVVTAVTRLLPSSNTYGIAGATLAAAALARPLYRRVQHAVDRRFNRARYDAQLTVERFGVTLRAEIDTPSVLADLQGAVHETLEPQTLGIWLRGAS